MPAENDSNNLGISLHLNSSIKGDQLCHPVDLPHHYFVYQNRHLINTHCKAIPILAFFGAIINVIVIFYLIKLIQRHPIDDRIRNFEISPMATKKWFRFKFKKIKELLVRLARLYKSKYFRALSLFVNIKEVPVTDVEAMVGYHISTISSPTKRIITDKRHHNNYSVGRHKTRVYKGNDISLLSYDFPNRGSNINKWETEDSSSYIILMSLCLINLLMITLLVIRNSVECLANKPFEHIRKVLSVHEMHKYNEFPLIQNNKKFEQIYYNLRFFTTPATFVSSKINNLVKINRIKRSSTLRYISSIGEKKWVNEKGYDGFRFDNYKGGNQEKSENIVEIDSEIEAFIKFILKNLRNSRAFKIYLSYGWNFFMARFHVPMTFVFVSFNFFATLLYALNRYIYTVYEFEYHYWCSSKKTFLALSICGLLSGLLYIPATFNYKLVAIRVSSEFLLHGYNLDQNNNYHLNDNLFPMIIYYSLIWGKTRYSKRAILIGLIYEITRELIGKFIIITIMGYLIIAISREMKDKRWVIDKKHWISITKLPIRLTPKNLVQGAGGNRIKKDKISKDLIRKTSKIINKNELVMENNYDRTQMEILYITNLSSRHYYNWSRKFSLTLLRVFLMQALMINIPVTFVQLTYKLWIKRVNILHLSFIFTGYQIFNLVSIVLPFPLTLAIMICS
ncbi:unnamed protein product [Gordionus sp. m RMFG-2023]